MTLLPEVHESLASAVATRRARRPWWRSARGAAWCAAGAAIVSGSAVAATTGWHPILGDSDRGHPQEARAPVPGDQRAAIAVLRRAQTDADRTPHVLAVLRLLVRAEINGVHVDGVRLLRTRSDGVTILVPAERVGRHDNGYQSSVRRQVLCVLTSTRFRPGTKGLSGAGQVCGTTADLRTTGIRMNMHTQNGWVVNGLVPDGVARVVIRLRRHHSVTAPVRDNLYEVNTGRELPPAWGVRWLDADGRPIAHRVRKSG
jgi:hypothetical protein